jgi:hypothetical protein
LTQDLIAAKRNLDRFPADFMIQLTAEEASASRCQIGILKRGQHVKYLETIHNLFDAIRQLMAPPASPRRPIGFQVRERRGVYRAQTKRRI